MMVMTLRMNEKEEEVHLWLKKFFGFEGLHGEDSQTLKQSEVVAHNVLRNFFGDELSSIFKLKSKVLLEEKRVEEDNKRRESITSKKENNQILEKLRDIVIQNSSEGKN